MVKMNENHTFLKGWKETDAPALVASATDDVSQSELMMIENEIKKSTQFNKYYQNCPRKNQKRGWEICTTSWYQSSS